MRVKLLWLVLPLLLAIVPVSFAAQLTITTSVTSGGTVSPATRKIPVAQNGSLDVTFTANEGYYLAEVKVDKLAVPVTDRQVFTYQFTQVQSSHTIAAKFTKNPVITAKGSTGGIVTPSGKISVPYGASKAFTFSPLSGYHLESVQVDRVVVDSVAGYSFENVISSHALSVKFVVNSYEITTSAGDGGFIAPAGMSGVKHGQTKVFTIKPNSGMRIATLSVNNVPVDNLPLSGPYSLKLTVTDNIAIAATFSGVAVSGLQKLNGTYRLVSDRNSFGLQTGGNQNVSESIEATAFTATFDGKGGCKVIAVGKSFSRSVDQSGNEIVNVNTNGSPSGCSYTVSDEGNFTLNVSSPEGSDTVSGWVSSDSNVLLLGGYSQFSGANWHEYAAETVTGVRQGSGVTKATVAGTYHLTSRDSTLWKSVPQQDGKTYVSDNYYGNRVTATFDAAGGCSINVIGTEFNKNMDNLGNEYVNVSPEAVTLNGCSYTISSSGAFTLKITNSDGSPETVNGWIGVNGSTLLMGGAEVNTDTNGTGYTANHTFGVKAGSGMTSANLNGIYRLIGSEFSFIKYLSNNQSFVNKALSGTKVMATFDGVGTCTINFINENYFRDMVNNLPTVQVDSSSGAMSACSYSIQPDGEFTLTMTGPEGNDSATGRASADGKTLLIGGPFQHTDNSNNNHYGLEMMVGAKVK